MVKEQWNEIEVVPNRYQDRDYTVNISIPEFTCVCPRTGLPDFATITVNYVPTQYLIELKSMKYYILNYRNLGIFHEEATNRIMDDIKSAVQPKSIEVVGDFHTRGGIKTLVTSRWPE